MIRTTRAEFLKDLEALVNIDSYSKDPAGTAAVGDVMKAKFEALGWHIEEHHPSPEVGPVLVITNQKEATTYDVLLLGHIDTVFKTGTVKERPFSMDDNFAYGPGVADMKDGVLAAYYVCKSLVENNELGQMSICVCLNPDEEISSRYSRPYIEELGKKSKHCIVLESARINGNFVNERKGIGKYTVEFLGKAAHAAVNPDKGANAINQFLLTGQEILSWVDPEAGTTINIGTVEGGTTPNTIPDYVKIQVDIRLQVLAEGERIHQLMMDIPNHMTIKGVTAKVTGDIMRPPMPKTEKTLDFCKAVDHICQSLGIEAEWESTGGGSDGNFVAALGVPTIDGFGPVGGNGHSTDECLELKSLMDRLELLYETVKWCGRNA
ncbi:M20 family metallopeptidase [uncultured Veillonella sp.]|uniref:M20 family metallopeptidase n=1 Tax=uncultured Veillonella sp. TaxID=159268 RepID=UPI0025D39F4D|nr:M20 family metallopeptidase [uncultured Veillonella sp.]MDY3974503.1 M20 family metallopeptidase [Veillonella caviae]